MGPDEERGEDGLSSAQKQKQSRKGESGEGTAAMGNLPQGSPVSPDLRILQGPTGDSEDEKHLEDPSQRLFLSDSSIRAWLIPPFIQIPILLKASPAVFTPI